MNNLGNDIINEIKYSFSRSSGAGGQNVNKVNSKVELRFSITESELLTEEQKNILYSKLENRINNKGELILTSQVDRSQLKNKELVTTMFFNLIKKALTLRKKRKATKPSKSSKETRLKNKKIHSDKKQNRSKLYKDREG